MAALSSDTENSGRLAPTLASWRAARTGSANGLPPALFATTSMIHETGVGRPFSWPTFQTFCGVSLMNVLLIGSGGREHALAWALSASPLLTKLYCAPGNAGIETVAECVPIAAMDFDRLIAFAQEKKIDFVVIAPDNPLVGGLWDRFEAVGIRATGPSMAGAILEGSKGFVKDLCHEV